MTPQLPNIPIVLGWRDVDDPTDHDGPIDPDPAPQDGGQPPNDWHGREDNFGTWVGVDPSLSANSATTDANGQVRVTFDMASMQPGDNFRVVAAARQEELDRIHPRSADEDSEVFFDENGNGLYNTGEPTLFESGAIHGAVATRMLTFWRYLHVEVDSMGPVAGNTVPNYAHIVTQMPDGTYRVYFGHWLDTADGNNRFEDGTLMDSEGYVYDIVSNTAGYVTVHLSDNPMPPMPDADIWLQDDDYLKDGWDVPMPDLGLMAQAYGAAFIEPVLDGGGDPANNQDNLPFKPHVVTSDDNTLRQQIYGGKDSSGSRGFWVAYVQNAYQPEKSLDFDPNSAWLAGINRQPGGSLVFAETARDVARDKGFPDEQVFVQRMVVHEIAHSFGVNDDQGTGASVMHQGDFDNPNLPEGSRFNESQLLTLRRRVSSPGV